MQVIGLFGVLGGLIFVGSQAWEWATFIKGDYGAIQTNGGNILQFVDTDGKRVAIGDIAVVEGSDRAQHQRKNGLWFVSEGTLPTYTVDEVYNGLEANPNVLVRTQALTDEGEKTDKVLVEIG